MSDAHAQTKYLNSSQQRILGLLRCLAGNEMEGLAPGDIAKLNGCSASQVTRDLDNLYTAGLAEQLPNTGRWRLGPQIVQIAMKHMTALDRARKRLDETTNRYSRA
jgi:DNA-binding IclR family transcriptional regulator